MDFGLISFIIIVLYATYHGTFRVYQWWQIYHDNTRDCKDENYDAD